MHIIWGKVLLLLAINLIDISSSAQAPVFEEEIPQSTSYLNSCFTECKKKDALFVRYMYPVNDSLFVAHVNDLSGTRKMDGHFLLRGEKWLEHGQFIFYYPGGKIESKGGYEYGYKAGAWERYSEDGMRKPDRYYNPASASILRALKDEP
jgi:hypothetical protein